MGQAMIDSACRAERGTSSCMGNDGPIGQAVRTGAHPRRDTVQGRPQRQAPRAGGRRRSVRRRRVRRAHGRRRPTRRALLHRPVAGFARRPQGSPTLHTPECTVPTEPQLTPHGVLTMSRISHPATVANRRGGSNDPRADAAVRFAVKVARERGHVSDAAASGFAATATRTGPSTRKG